MNPKGEREALIPASDDRSRPRRTLRHTDRGKVLRGYGPFQAAPTYLEFILYAVECGSVISDDTYEFRTFARSP